MTAQTPRQKTENRRTICWEMAVGSREIFMPRLRRAACTLPMGSWVLSSALEDRAGLDLENHGSLAYDSTQSHAEIIHTAIEW